MEVIYEAIRDGADAFLMAEYKICFLFVGCFSAVIYALIGVLQEVRRDPRPATRDPRPATQCRRCCCCSCPRAHRALSSPHPT